MFIIAAFFRLPLTSIRRNKLENVSFFAYFLPRSEPFGPGGKTPLSRTVVGCGRIPNGLVKPAPASRNGATPQKIERHIAAFTPADDETYGLHLTFHLHRSEPADNSGWRGLQRVWRIGSDFFHR
jgi:hypothetical protein